MGALLQVFSFYTGQWLAISLGTVVLFVVYFWAINSSRRLAVMFPNLRGPKPDPFLDHLPDILRMKGQPHLQIDEYYKQYGKIFPMWHLKKPTLVVAEPTMLREILVKNFQNFPDRPTIFKLPKPLDIVLAAAKGQHWQHIRGTLSPSFSAHKMKMMLPLINDACNQLMMKLSKVAVTGESFNISKYHDAVALDVIMTTAFGIKANYQTDPDDPMVARTNAAMNQTALTRMLMALVFLLPFGHKLMQNTFVTGVLFKSFIDFKHMALEMMELKRNEKIPGRKDLLDLMLAAKDPDTGEAKLTDEEIVAQCVVFLLAGHDTTAGTLALVCYYLATNPDVQERLHEEIDGVLSDAEDLPAYDTLQELPYLDMVISETLRLCPAGVFIDRIALDDCTVQGVKIPKDTQIIVPVYSLHRDPEVWPEPEKFDPRRFSPEMKRSRDPYTYMPFSTGPRNCIGMRFALMEMKVVLARMLKKYRFDIAPETQIPPKVELRATLKCPDGIVLKIIKRS